MWNPSNERLFLASTLWQHLLHLELDENYYYFLKVHFHFFLADSLSLENHATLISLLFVPCIGMVFSFFLLQFCFIKIQGVKHAECIARAKYLLGV